MSAPEFTATADATPSGPNLVLAGELDAATAPAAREAIRDLTLRPGELLVVDLAELRFCDSSGISALIAARVRTHAAGAEIALAAVPPQLGRTLALLGLAALFPAYPTAAQARAGWTASSAGG